MASVTYHVVVAFDRNEEGDLVPGQGAELPSSEAAAKRARSIAAKHAGVVAFSRAGDPATGEFGEATVVVSLGEVDLDALSADRVS